MYSFLLVSLFFSLDEVEDQLLLQVVSDKKLFTKNDSHLKYPSMSVSPLKNKNEIILPKPTNKSSKKELKSLPEGALSNHLIRVSLSFKTWSNQKISWNSLPSTISDLGKVRNQFQFHAVLGFCYNVMLCFHYFMCLWFLTISGSYLS